MPHKVFLVGEGPGDIGGLASEPPYQNDHPGYLQPMIRKLATGAVTFSGKKLSLLGRQRIKGVADALSKKAAVAVVLAELDEADVMVFATDLDGGPELRRKAQREAEITRMSNAIRAGVEVAESHVKCVPGIPCRTIEAWALGDLVAVEAVVGDQASLPPGKKPEDLWGSPRDPSSDHPKNVLKRILGRARWQDLAEIAEASDPSKVRMECPLSFDPFAGAVKQALA